LVDKKATNGAPTLDQEDLAALQGFLAFIGRLSADENKTQEPEEPSKKAKKAK